MSHCNPCNPGAGPRTQRAVSHERIRIYVHDGSSDLETVSDNPGPGRLLDEAFQSAGRRLENVIGKLTKQPLVRYDLDDGEGLLDASDRESAFLEDAQTEPEVEVHIHKPGSDDITESDIVGPGRILGKFYRFAGNKVERFLGKLADKAGFGPDASDRHIRSHFHVALVEGVFHQPKYKKKFLKDVRRLLNYTHSPTTSTQLKALVNIVNLSAVLPEVQGIFRANGAMLTLETARKISLFYGASHHRILSASRLALISVEENALNKSAKTLVFGYGISVDFPMRTFPTLRVSFTDRDKVSFQTWNEVFDLMIRFLDHPTYAFMAFRYLYHWHLNFILDGFRLTNELRIGNTNSATVKEALIIKLGDVLANMLADVEATVAKVEVDYVLVLVNGMIAGGREVLLDLTSHQDSWSEDESIAAQKISLLIAKLLGATEGLPQDIQELLRSVPEYTEGQRIALGRLFFADLHNIEDCKPSDPAVRIPIVARKSLKSFLSEYDGPDERIRNLSTLSFS